MSLLEVKNLSVRLPIKGELRPVLLGVDLSIEAGESLGLIGESGSGKSITSRSIIRLLPEGAEVEGEITFKGNSILKMGSDQLRSFRAHDVAMVFQDPQAYINPTQRIGDYLAEGMRYSSSIKKADINSKALNLLEDVGIDNARGRMRQYPQELSGGMLQRVTIAAALGAEPQLLLADEPTTALDVTTQSDVMAILHELRTERSLAMLFVTHDLELAIAACDRIAVMYGGTLVELSGADALRHHPRHPYTAGLIAARPSLNTKSERLADIPGSPIEAGEVSNACPFKPRCDFARDICAQKRPLLRPVDGGYVACHRTEEIRHFLRERVIDRESADG